MAYHPRVGTTAPRRLPPKSCKLLRLLEFFNPQILSFGITLAFSRSHPSLCDQMSLDAAICEAKAVNPKPDSARSRSDKELLILAALLIALALQLAGSVRQWSITSDEINHLHAGYRYLTCGDFGWNPEHPRC